MLQDLYEYFGRPAAGSDNSVLACQLASSAWRGYAIDKAFIYGTWAHAAGAAALIEERNSPVAVRARVEELRLGLPVLERAARKLNDGVTDSKAATLEAVGKKAAGTRLGTYCAAVAVARSKDKEADQCRKLIKAGRFYPQFRVLGALSGRMSGGGGLNPQGISTRKKGSKIRDGFTMASGVLSELSGGDFASFQVAISAAVWDDKALTEALRGGKKFHGLFGASIYDMAYDDVKNDDEKYGRAKSGVFLTMFGGQAAKLAETMGITLERAEGGLADLRGRFPGIGRAEDELALRFCAMSQAVDGGPVVWREPDEFVESVYGVRRYYTLENSIQRALFDLAEKLPPWLDGKDPVERRVGRKQKSGGALRSALYGAAFGLQGRTLRTAQNHRIQSPEASIAKSLQRQLWDEFQPAGVHPWRLSLLPVHDELVVAHVPGLPLAGAVDRLVETFKGRVPLIAMDWVSGLTSWGILK